MGGEWLGLWSQMDYSSLWNDSSLCSFSRWRLKQFNDDAQTVSLSSLFQVLITRSLKKCCLKSVLTRFLFSFNEWPLVQPQGENSKKVSNLTEDKPCTILKTSIRSALTRLSSNDHTYRRFPYSKIWVSSPIRGRRKTELARHVTPLAMGFYYNMN